MAPSSAHQPLGADLGAIQAELASSNPQLYRQIALYLQILRDVLPASVDQVCFHLATQVYPGRYRSLSSKDRRRLHGRLQQLVQRCTTRLTLEQLLAQAVRMARQSEGEATAAADATEAEAHHPGLRQLPDATAQASQPQAGRQGPEPANGSIVLGFDLPVDAPWLGFDGPPDPAASEADQREPSAAADGDTRDPGSTMPLVDLLGQLIREALQETGDDTDDLGVPDGPGHADASPTLIGGDSLQAFGQLRFAGAARAAAALATAQNSGTVASFHGPASSDSTDGARWDRASGELPWPFRLPANGGLLPRDPIALLAWLDGLERALARQLRSLSYAINQQLLKVGLSPVLLPIGVLDAALSGAMESQSPVPNLLRLQLPVPTGANAQGLPVQAVLLRCGDLELEHPRLRRARADLHQQRHERRRMAHHYQRLLRRLEMREAEALWQQDIRTRSAQIST